LGKVSLEGQTEILMVKFTVDTGTNVLKKEGRWDSHRIRPVDDIRHGSDANTVK
jgi:hypothetical protein